MTRILLATRSEPKAREIDAILGPLRIGVITLGELLVEPDPGEDDLESHETFRDNALAKARWFAARLSRPAMADDSGLRVDALGGRPGVRTKRFSGRADLSGERLDQANNQRLLDELNGVPDADRRARYVCCAAIAWPDGGALAALGTVTGWIAREPRGEGGFGYDPIFHVPQLDARFAEVSGTAKNAMSHRARAFRALATLLARPPWSLAPQV
jgi:XTP/dITP diphosphohydrolase